MKRWKVLYHKDAYKFLENKGLLEDFENSIRKFLYEGKKVDIKKLKGKWEGYYRVRLGKVRIIFCVDYKNRAIRVYKFKKMFTIK